VTQAYDRLKELLEELFQFDREDLDLPWKLTKEDLEDRHVLFQSEDKTTYIRAMLQRILSETAATESAM
jgi:hypothetical protein